MLNVEAHFGLLEGLQNILTETEVTQLLSSG